MACCATFFGQDTAEIIHLVRHRPNAVRCAQSSWKKVRKAMEEAAARRRCEESVLISAFVDDLEVLNRLQDIVGESFRAIKEREDKFEDRGTQEGIGEREMVR